MTYVREQTSAELAAHMRSLQAMPGWFDPLADRLWQEVQSLQHDNAALMEDAARYRWLRNTDPQPARMLDVCNDFLSIIDGKELDEAIDAALAQKEES